MKSPFHKFITVPAAALAVLVVLAACGRKDTVADRSAKAFREAQQKGIPVGGDGHGGHAAGEGEEHATIPGMDHSEMNAQSGQSMAGMDHSKMNMQGGQSMTGMDHSKMQHGQQPMAGMDHSQMQHGQQPTAGMDHGQMQPGQPMAGMDHANMPGMQHGAAAAPVVIPPPTSNAEIQRLRPAATLKDDPFDAPAQSALAETAKAVQGAGDEGLARGITPGEDHENVPTSAPAIRENPAPVSATAAPAMPMDHSQHGSTPPRTQSHTTAASQAQPVAETIYTCPMHPEVTSDKPGQCPKCGMTLVKKQ